MGGHGNATNSAHAHMVGHEIPRKIGARIPERLGKRYQRCNSAAARDGRWTPPPPPAWIPGGLWHKARRGKGVSKWGGLEVMKVMEVKSRLEEGALNSGPKE